MKAEREQWAITPEDLKLMPGEGTLRARSGARWASIDIDDHVGAVVVLADTQELADERARRIVEAVVPPKVLTGKEIRKGTGDVLKDIAYAQRFTESLQDGLPGQMGLELDFVDRALRVAAGEIKRLREAHARAKERA